MKELTRLGIEKRDFKVSSMKDAFSSYFAWCVNSDKDIPKETQPDRNLKCHTVRINNISFYTEEVSPNCNIILVYTTAIIDDRSVYFGYQFDIDTNQDEYLENLAGDRYDMEWSRDETIIFSCVTNMDIPNEILRTLYEYKVAIPFSHNGLYIQYRIESQTGDVAIVLADAGAEHVIVMLYCSTLKEAIKLIHSLHKEEFSVHQYYSVCLDYLNEHQDL